MVYVWSIRGMIKSFIDWWWWHFTVGENEFHPKLDFNAKKVHTGKTTIEKEVKRLTVDRERAHRLEQKYNKGKKK